MTEVEWRACADPQALLAYVEGNASIRALRLLCSACFRRAWHLLETDALRQAIHVLDCFADGETDEGSFRAVGNTTHPLMNYREEIFSGQCRDNVCLMAYAVNAAFVAIPDYGYRKSLEFLVYAAESFGDDERAAQVGLIREVFGNPFRRVVVSAAWQTPTVLSLAHAAYDDRSLPLGTLDPFRLAILADALEEVGCNDEQVLSHFRGPGLHVRGCWLIDALLGKS